MKAYREQDLDGVVIEAESSDDNEFLASLWCGKAKLACFDREGGLYKLTFTPTDRGEPRSK